MLVQCPNCHTTYRVSENIVSKSKPTFRCSRCKNVFVLGSKPGAGETAATAPPLREESPELSFVFPPHDRSHGSAAESRETATAGNGPEAAPGKHAETITTQQHEDWTITPRDAVEETFSLKDEKSFAETQRPTVESFDFANERPAVTKHQESPSEAGAEPSPSQPFSAAPYLLLCCGLALFFSALTLLHKARPGPIETSLQAIPWIGSSVLKNDHLRHGIVLQAGRPRFQRILGNREVFMLSGVAVNRNRVKVREVKIEGYVFGSDGKTIERQTITVGNAISSKIVRDLTSQEITTLQRQSPIRRFEILPDESAPFSIVFLKSSAQIKSFGYRVLSADES